MLTKNGCILMPGMKKKEAETTRQRGRPGKDSKYLNIRLRLDLSEALEGLVGWPHPTKTEIVEEAIEREIKRRKKKEGAGD